MFKVVLKDFVQLLRESERSHAIFTGRHGSKTYKIFVSLEPLAMVFDGQIIRLSSQKGTTGGKRFYILCPNCQRCCLYLIYDVGRLSCRICSNMHLRSLNRSKKDCTYFFELAEKEAKKVNPDYKASDYIRPDFPERPKGMHRTTYQKRLSKYMSYFEKGEMLWLLSNRLL